MESRNQIGPCLAQCRPSSSGKLLISCSFDIIFLLIRPTVPPESNDNGDKKTIDQQSG